MSESPTPQTASQVIAEAISEHLPITEGYARGCDSCPDFIGTGWDCNYHQADAVLAALKAAGWELVPRRVMTEIRADLVVTANSLDRKSRTLAEVVDRLRAAADRGEK